MPADATCLRCGYALVHLQHPRCPECGRAFDPRYASTYAAPSTQRQHRDELRQFRLEEAAREPSARRRIIIRVSLLLAIISLLSTPPFFGGFLWFNWIALIMLALAEFRRASARAELGLPPYARPPMGRYGWKFFCVAALAFVPLLMAIGFLIHLPLFAREVEEIEASSFHYHPPPRWVGALYVEVDRCPHATYFIAPLSGAPILRNATLVHRNSMTECAHTGGIPLFPEWRVNLRQGRGRDPRG